MKTLFQATVVSEINDRLAMLTPQSQRQWGKMNVSQMLAHCSTILEIACDQKSQKRLFIGRILGPLFKKEFLSEKPFKINSPTAKSFIIADDRDLNKERERLVQLINLFYERGEANCTKQPHAFFGKLSTDEWGLSMYKHLDHHLRQFCA